MRDTTVGGTGKGRKARAVQRSVDFNGKVVTVKNSNGTKTMYQGQGPKSAKKGIKNVRQAVVARNVSARKYAKMEQEKPAPSRPGAIRLPDSGPKKRSTRTISPRQAGVKNKVKAQGSKSMSSPSMGYTRRGKK